ncbi:MAG: hypothetical protein IPK69_08900 [Phycisphaerales bacterium]|nr:MAG: hypothetical protein IPK69_08900 [Phycisphaerales bacterium]
MLYWIVPSPMTVHVAALAIPAASKRFREPRTYSLLLSLVIIVQNIQYVWTEIR